MTAQPHGLVPHVIVGSLTSADMMFHQASSKVSAHFGVSKDGHILQWVDTDDKAWAEAAGNPLWWSAECEGMDTEPHTPAQIDALAHLLAWLHGLSPFPLQVTDDVNGFGVISHRDGGKAWGGHSCPGDQRHAQRGEIVLRAKGILNPPEMKPMFDPPLNVAAWKLLPQGLVAVGPDGGVFCEPPTIYRGGPNGQPYWAGMKPSAVDAPNADEAASGHEYVIVNTHGQRYAYPA